MAEKILEKYNEFDFNKPKPSVDGTVEDFNFFQKIKKIITNPRYKFKYTMMWSGALLAFLIISTMNLKTLNFSNSHMVLASLDFIIGFATATKSMLMYKEFQDFPKNIKKTHATLLGIVSMIFLVTGIVIML